MSQFILFHVIIIVKLKSFMEQITEMKIWVGCMGGFDFGVTVSKCTDSKSWFNDESKYKFEAISGSRNVQAVKHSIFSKHQSLRGKRFCSFYICNLGLNEILISFFMILKNFLRILHFLEVWDSYGNELCIMYVKINSILIEFFKFNNLVLQ